MSLNLLVAISSLTLLMLALDFLLREGEVILLTRPERTLSSALMAGFLGVRGLRGVFSFFAVGSFPDVKEEVADEAPRTGASGRAPDSISSLRAAASRLMMRKRPSIESYVAP